MDPQSNINKLVNFFFTLELNLKIYHWNTNSFPRHKASDELGGKILELTDKFVEIFIGRYKVKPNIERVKIENIFTTDNGNVDLPMLLSLSSTTRLILSGNIIDAISSSILSKVDAKDSAISLIFWVG